MTPEQKVTLVDKIIKHRLSEDIIKVQRFEHDLGERIRLHVLGGHHNIFYSLPKHFIPKGNVISVFASGSEYSFELEHPVLMPYCLMPGVHFEYEPNELNAALFRNWVQEKSSLSEEIKDLRDGLSGMLQNLDDPVKICKLVPDAKPVLDEFAKQQNG